MLYGRDSVKRSPGGACSFLEWEMVWRRIRKPVQANRMPPTALAEKPVVMAIR